jgi:hypothetical protein
MHVWAVLGRAIVSCQIESVTLVDLQVALEDEDICHRTGLDD